MGSALVGPFGRCELGTAAITIGRLASNTLFINDSQVSLQHAEVRPEGAGYVLIDLGSTNGTMLNGQPLLPQIPQPLRNGDRITIGSASITVELAAAVDAYAPTQRLSGQVSSGFAPTQPIGTPLNLPTYGPEIVYAPPPPFPANGMVLAPPPARQRSRKRRILLIVGSIVAGFAVIICACLGLLLYINSTHSPQAITNQYYSDIKGRDYADAYQLLTGSTQAFFDLEASKNHVASGQQLFINLYSCLDLQLGPVTAYTTTLLSQDKVQAVVGVSVTRSREQYTDKITLNPENLGWAVSFPSPPPNQHCT